MNDAPHNWGEFTRRPATPPSDSGSPDFDERCAVALSGPAGVGFMKALRARYIDSRENPLASAEALRVRVTQQQFVRDLEDARDRGLAALAAKRKAP
jgi:hypothetical protein